MSATRVQITVDCADPGLLVRFWAQVLHYVVEPPPAGFTGWNAFWHSIGVPQDELDESSDLGDSVVDPDGAGPRIWFQLVPEPKSVKNRLHLDLAVSGGRTVPLPERRARVDAEAARIVAAGATVLGVLDADGIDHYAVTLADPEGNEFCLH